jgi:hypothetical protein
LKLGNAEELETTAEALTLQQANMRADLVLPKYTDDALCVARATITHADVIVSWNFKHLVNPAQIRAFNGITLAEDYGMVVILSPEYFLVLGCAFFTNRRIQMVFLLDRCGNIFDRSFNRCYY